MSPLDRTLQPASGAIRHFDFPEVERRPLSQGLDLRVARLSRLPMVSVNLFFRAGEAGLSDEWAGLAVLTGDALEGGTKRRSGSALAEALESIGARTGVTTGWEGTSVALSCLADRLEEAMPLLIETMREPDFPEDEVDRVREQQLAALRQRKMDPGALASDEATRRYFAAGQPYARGQGGTEESVGAATTDAMRGYVESNYRPEGGGLVVVGDLDPDEVEVLAERYLSEWRGAPPAVVDFDPRPPKQERAIFVVDRPGSVQSEIRVGHVGASRSTPDYFALSIGNMLLGGTFTSRLNLNLREKNGFTYGVRSSFGFRSRPGPFQVSTAVGSEVTADAVRETLFEMQHLVEGGATEDEVAAARDYSAGIFGLQLETAGQIGSRLSQILMHGLDDDYYHRYRDNVRGVTTEQVSAAVRAHMRPDEVQIVVVGDAEVVVGPLQELGVGSVTVV
jgi:predicted Zn-dependent peptidase